MCSSDLGSGGGCVERTDTDVAGRRFDRGGRVVRTQHAEQAGQLADRVAGGLFDGVEELGRCHRVLLETAKRGGGLDAHQRHPVPSAAGAVPAAPAKTVKRAGGAGGGAVGARFPAVVGDVAGAWGSGIAALNCDAIATSPCLRAVWISGYSQLDVSGGTTLYLVRSDRW